MDFDTYSKEMKVALQVLQGAIKKALKDVENFNHGGHSGMCESIFHLENALKDYWQVLHENARKPLR